MSIKNLMFNIIEDNTSDENWMMWKMAHEHSLEITKNFRKDLTWDEITFAPYKRSHSCYGLILDEEYMGVSYSQQRHLTQIFYQN